MTNDARRLVEHWLPQAAMTEAAPKPAAPSPVDELRRTTEAMVVDPKAKFLGTRPSLDREARQIFDELAGDDVHAYADAYSLACEDMLRRAKEEFDRIEDSKKRSDSLDAFARAVYWAQCDARGVYPRSGNNRRIFLDKLRDESTARYYEQEQEDRESTARWYTA